MPSNEQIWRYVERGRRRFFGRYTRKLEKDIRAIIAPIMEAMRYSTDLDSIKNMVEVLQTDHINATLVEMYKDVGSYFGSKVERQIKKSIIPNMSAICKNMTEEDRIWGEWLEQYAMQRAGVKFLSINKTVRNELSGLINNMIAEGMRDGLGINEIARKLEKELPNRWVGKARSRARTIAQTEVTTASNTVSIQAIEQTGYDYLKTWVTAPPGTVKNERHTLPGAIREYTVKKDEMFYVDGGQGYKPMMYPGDPNGSVENVVNCRCTLTYEII